MAQRAVAEKNNAGQVTGVEFVGQLVAAARFDAFRGLTRCS